MKTVVVEQVLLESEIKPSALLDEYRRLVEADVRAGLADPGRLVPAACPGCRAEPGRPAFRKAGLAYIECAACGSLYVSPRPGEEDLIRFYRDSAAARFWRERLLPATRETRREKMVRPRIQWLLDVADRHVPGARLAILDGHHTDLFVEELTREGRAPFAVVLASPLADLELGGRSFPDVALHPTLLGDLPSIGPADLYLAFDLLDRCPDPDGLLAAARDALAPGGLVLATTLLGSGFDVQVLWERSGTIYPPERMNLLSVEGLLALVGRHSFEVLELSTPGTFDVEIVQRAIRADPEGSWPRFIRYLVQNRNEGALLAFQEYLQRYRLSSFARIVLRKSA